MEVSNIQYTHIIQQIVEMSTGCTHFANRGEVYTLFHPPQCPAQSRHLGRAEWASWTPWTIQQGVILSHDSYVKCDFKTEIVGCKGNALRRSPEPQNHKSGHLYAWDLHPLWAIRTQSSDHSVFEPGCTRVILRAQRDFHSTGHVLPLWLPGLRPTPTCPPVAWTAHRALALLRMLPLTVGNLCVTLIAYSGSLPW